MSDSTHSAPPHLRYRGRFAPSPTGPLHFGSLIAALGSWLRARSQSGIWLIRLEDIDPPREKPGAAQDILRTLDALGLRSDEPVLVQSSRRARHQQCLQNLVEDKFAFSCCCTRADLAPDGLHHGACRRDAGARSWRLRVPDVYWSFVDLHQGRFDQAAKTIGDFVIWRADDLPAYQMAVVVDDDDQGITEVVRGSDLLDSTPRQIFLQQCLRIRKPDYLHLPLLLGADNTKLSKSLSSEPISVTDPMPTLRRALFLLGQDTQESADSVDQLLQQAAQQFDLQRLPRQSIRLAGDGITPLPNVPAYRE